MAKKKEVEAKEIGEQPASETTKTLGTRLSTEQKDLIERAAQLQSWTSSNLMRKAAVERAAHIVNTGLPSRFAFGVLAERLAIQLCAPELLVERTEGWETIQWPIFDEGDQVKVVSLALDELYKLQEALHLGGVEFMEQVVDACQRKLSAVGLPEPIDPNTLD
jgi:hypothetical protein